MKLYRLGIEIGKKWISVLMIIFIIAGYLTITIIMVNDLIINGVRL